MSMISSIGELSGYIAASTSASVTLEIWKDGWRAEKYAASEIGNRKGQSVRMRERRVEKGSEEFNEY